MYNCFNLIKEAKRGEGSGAGGPRQGDGGSDYCKCPDCGRKFKHKKGKPCATKTCPDCDVELIGVDKKKKKD